MLLWSRYRPGLKVGGLQLDLVLVSRFSLIHACRPSIDCRASWWVCAPSEDVLSAGEEVQTPEDAYSPNPTLNSKVSLWHGDITRLEIDAIVCSSGANLTSSALPGTVFAAVHRAAGSLLQSECQLLLRCEPANAKVAFGYNLPARCELE